jgi:adenosylhomocysteine nucleosidase
MRTTPTSQPGGSVIGAEPSATALATRPPMRQAAEMTTKPLAFVCAMPMELTPLTRELALTETDVGGVAVHRGTLDDRDVVAIVTGMGTELATAAIERLLDTLDVEHVLVVGITGALEDETPIGTLVLPEVVVLGASGREHRPTRIGDAAHEGRMWTTDTLTTDLEVLAELREQGVVSLDMETAAIADVCESRGVPWSVFRTISDRASDGTTDEEVFKLSNMDGTPNHEAIEAYVKKYPERIPVLAQMGEDCALATRAASDAAIRAVEMYAAANPA